MLGRVRGRNEEAHEGLKHRRADEADAKPHTSGCTWRPSLDFTQARVPADAVTDRWACSPAGKCRMMYSCLRSDYGTWIVATRGSWIYCGRVAWSGAVTLDI